MKPETITLAGLALLLAGIVALATGCGTFEAEGKMKATQKTTPNP